MSSVEARVARILAIGTGVAVAFLATGTVLLIAGGTSPLAPDWPPLDVASLAADLVALRPTAFLWLGLIATIATPLLRVAASTWGFGRAGNRRLATLGLAVLVVIGLAVVAGSMAG